MSVTLLHLTNNKTFIILRLCFFKNCEEDLCSGETRVVRCSDLNAICDPNKRPISEKKCEVPSYLACGTWTASSWSNVNYLDINLRV